MPTDRDPLALLETWDGLGVVLRHDQPTGTWIIIALHDDRLGRPAGGTRMKVYPALADALEDAQRLAEGMTHKWAGLDLPFGGGKAVLAIPRPLEAAERAGLIDRYAGLIASLNGTFRTGPDLGTTPEDMARIAAHCPHVLGYDFERRYSVDPGPYTARGVYESLKAAVAAAFGDDDLAGRTVLIQGVGDVGEPLARLLAADGARLLLADVDRRRAGGLAAELGAEAVDPDAVYDLPCDVYAPCAVGGTLNAGTIPRLACRVVAGSANNQLATAEDAERLHRRGILYAPDYVANSGGAMAIALMQQGLWDEEALMARVAGIGRVMAEILAEAQEQGVSPLRAARRRVERRLAAAQSSDMRSK